MVSWWRLVWGTNHIPKHAFICWLAIKGRLLTKSRLVICVYYVGWQLKLSHILAGLSEKPTPKARHHKSEEWLWQALYIAYGRNVIPVFLKE